MQYNLHPIFVHFPIAFLFLYSLLVILPVEKWFPKVSWGPMRFILLSAGLLGAFVSSATGEVAKDLTKPDHDLVEMHEWFANATTFFYGILFTSEIWKWVTRFVENMEINFLIPIVSFLGKILSNKIIRVLLALGGLMAISITGMLGGIMVYGVSADPLAPLLVDILDL